MKGWLPAPTMSGRASSLPLGCRPQFPCFRESTPPTTLVQLILPLQIEPKLPPPGGPKGPSGPKPGFQSCIPPLSSLEEGLGWVGEAPSADTEVIPRGPGETAQQPQETRQLALISLGFGGRQRREEKDSGKFGWAGSLPQSHRSRQALSSCMPLTRIFALG